jgi:putative transposase
MAVEDLNIQSMLETGYRVGLFIELLQYKANLYGTHVVLVDLAETTKECSTCNVETHKPIWIREHACLMYGHTKD